MAKRKKTTEDQTEASENINASDDNFGLPEIEYEPIDRNETTEDTIRAEHDTKEVFADETLPEEPPEYVTEVAEEENQEYVFNESKEEGSSAARVMGGIVILLLIVGAVWFFMVYQPNKRREVEEKARQEEMVRLEAAKKIEADRLAELQRQEHEKRIADSLANAAPKEGSIETLSGRTGHYYVVVASDIDDDLIMDYAKKLTRKGISSKIIPPHGKVKFYRIAIAEGDTYSDTQSKADNLKGEFNEGAWVVKY